MEEQNVRPNEPIQRPEMRMNDANWKTYQRYLTKRLLKEGRGVVVPGGLAVDGTPWRGFKRSVQVQSFVMNQPEELLLDADERCKYAWRPREDPKHSTEALVRRGDLIPVDWNRVDEKSPLTQFVYEYSGTLPGGDGSLCGFVACGDYQLFEVPPHVKYVWYDEPVDATFAELQGLKPGLYERAQDWAAVNPGYEVQGADIAITDVQSVTQETRNPKMGGPPIQVSKRE